MHEVHAVERARFAHGLVLAVRDLLDLLAGAVHALIVDVHGVAQRTQVARERLGGGLALAVGKRGDGGVDGIHAKLRSVDVRQRRKAGERVGVDFKRQLVANRTADRGDEGLHAVRGEQAAGVLEHDAVDVCALDKLLGFVNVELVGVHRTQAVGQAAVRLGAEFLGQDEGVGDVVDVVEAVEGADHAEAVGVQPLHPCMDDVVGQEVEGRQVAGAHHGTELRVRRRLVDPAHALPRVFPQVAHWHVELDRGNQVDVLEAGVGDVVQQLHDVLGAHARGPDGLVRVAQRCIDDLDFALAVSGPTTRSEDLSEALRAQFFWTESSHCSSLETPDRGCCRVARHRCAQCTHEKVWRATHFGPKL